MTNYWSAYALAERGHEVFVVTNAGEVEDFYRICLLDGDTGRLTPSFLPAASVRVFGTETLNPDMGHVPLANPFVSKLASLATHVIRRHRCDLLYASYFEPFAVAGYLASQWTRIPLLVSHAGSDLERLMRVPQLATAYKEVLKAAAGVVTIEPLADRFIGMGVAADHIVHDPPFALPTDVFNPGVAPLDVEWTLAEIASVRPVSILLKPSRPFDASWPTIGLYGKVGEVKGAFDLVQALAQLKRKGLEFNLLTMAQGWQADLFRSAIISAGLEDRTWMLPFLAHWRVPSFIRACTTVCFLERDFPITLHSPMIPREILACARCLVVSKEVADKQVFRDAIVDRQNAVVVKDPRDHNALAAAFAYVLENTARALEIGNRGNLLSATLEDFASYAKAFEAMLGRFYRPNDRRAVKEKNPVAPPSIAELAHTVPALRLLLGEAFDDFAARYLTLARSGTNRFHVALDFCRSVQDSFVAGELKIRDYGCTRAAVIDILRYQKARLTISLDDDDGCPEPNLSGFGDQRHLAGVTPNQCPIVAGLTFVKTFEHDVTPLFSHPDSAKALRKGIARRTVHICFHRPANLAWKEFLISGETKAFIELCDGTRSTDDVVQDLVKVLCAASQKEINEIRSGSLSALALLQQMGVIAFACGDQAP